MTRRRSKGRINNQQKPKLFYFFGTEDPAYAVVLSNQDHKKHRYLVCRLYAAFPSVCLILSFSGTLSLCLFVYQLFFQSVSQSLSLSLPLSTEDTDPTWRRVRRVSSVARGKAVVAAVGRVRGVSGRIGCVGRWRVSPASRSPETTHFPRIVLIG